MHPGGAVLVNQALADRYWPGGDALGKRITVRKSAQGRPEFGEPVRATIVGVVGNVRHYSLDTDFVPEVYLPYTVTVWGWMSLVVRTAGDPAALVPTVARAARSVEPDLPLEGATFSNRVYDLPTSLRQSLAYRRFITGLLGAFALPAVLLAALGIFGVVAYLVTQRSREIGIRMALGAQRGNVLALVLAEGMRLAAVGILLGTLGAIVTTRWLSAELYESQRHRSTHVRAGGAHPGGGQPLRHSDSGAPGHGDRPGSHPPVRITTPRCLCDPRFPASAPSPSPASSSSWPRPGVSATATAIPTGATSARASRRPARCRARHPGSTRSRSGWTTRTTLRCRGSGSCAARWRSCTTGSTAAAKRSRYTERNVCICGGGRASLTRAVAALGQVNLGHFLPDYTAYEELLDIFKLFTSIPILLDGRDGLSLQPRAPPRGDHRPRTLGGAALESLQPDRAGDRRGRSSAELGRGRARARLLAADGRVLLALRLAGDGGWRRAGLGRAVRGRRGRRPGRALRRPDQELALSRLALQLDRGAAAGHRGGLQQRLVPRRRWQQAAAALRGSAAGADGASRRRPRRSGSRSCGSGRSWARGCGEAGVRFDLEPEGTFYCWGDVSGLPPAINDGMSFFRAALERKVICVPGEFFDVNPGKRRSGRPSRFRHYVRFSFGPEEATVVEGVRRIQEMVAELRACHPERSEDQVFEITRTLAALGMTLAANVRYAPSGSLRSAAARSRTGHPRSRSPRS